MARRGDGIYLPGRLVSRPPKQMPPRPMEVVSVQHPGVVVGERKGG